MKKLIKLIIFLLIIAGIYFVYTNMNNPTSPIETMDRNSNIPENMEKITPATDIIKPILHSSEYEDPIPMPGPINTAGAEDSAFITPDGNTFYFWFTPDPNIPPQKQLVDEVTGIYVSQKSGGVWQEPERIITQKSGKVALDGCEFVQDNEMYFCSTREGYVGIKWFKSEKRGDQWTVGEYAEEISDIVEGEMHITGNTLYFNSSERGGKGKNDLFMVEKENGKWGEPVNISTVNSIEHDSRPFVNQVNDELWFTRSYKGTPAIYRSKKSEGIWQTPELIISQFAGEPTLDNDGNLYFTHHFFKNNQMLEADIYVAYKK